jgi:predicted aldo/keto reductase-like oxidoreductase
MSDGPKVRSRRRFIKNGIAGFAGGMLVPSAVKKGKVTGLKQKKDRKFIYRTLGKTGIRLPIVSMGTYDATGLANIALDAGIVHIDTSAEYNQGNDEKMFGRIFKKCSRDSFIIGTSIGMWQYREADQIKKVITPEVLRKYIEGSLARLDLDYIDIYYLGGIKHKEILQYEPYWKILQEYKKAGKLRFLGVTTHTNEPEIIRTATDSGIYDVVLTSYNFRKTYREEIKKAIAYAAGKGIGIIAMKTQAGVYWDREDKSTMINMKAALKWALQDKNVHTAIPSLKTVDQLNEALSVMENLALTRQEKADLKLSPGGFSTGLFCSQCEKCLRQCPKNLDIPTLMRSYMYAYGYKNLAKARKTLDYVNLSDIPCVNCTTCMVNCSSGFDVKRKVMDIVRLKEVPEEFLWG